MFGNQKIEIDKKSEKKELHELNRAVIYIWHSGSNIEETGENVGHASIEIEGAYMSLWPKAKVKKEAIKSIVAKVPHKFVGSYAKDEQKEGRAAETMIYLYSLDVDAIKAKFQALKTGIKGWTLFGGICEDAQSCVSMVWRLLEAGGIRRLVSRAKESSLSSQHSTMGSILSSKHLVQFKSRIASKDAFYSSEAMFSLLIKSPDMLIPLLKSAKDKECERKEYATILQEDETYHPAKKTNQNTETKISKI